MSCGFAVGPHSHQFFLILAGLVGPAIAFQSAKRIFPRVDKCGHLRRCKESQNGTTACATAFQNADAGHIAQKQVAYIQRLMVRALEHLEAGRTAEVEPLCLKVLAVDVRLANA